MKRLISKAEMGPTGASYTVNVTNAGLQGRGLTAEGVNVSLTIPAGTNVVAANGPPCCAVAGLAARQPGRDVREIDAGEDGGQGSWG